MPEEELLADFGRDISLARGRARSKRYYKKHREKLLAAQAKHRRENPEKTAERHKKYYRENKEAYTKRHNHHRLKRKYGVTPDQIECQIKRQGGKCKVCRQEFTVTGPRKAVVDHFHVTGVFRGILCHNCNSAEGFLENPEDALRLYEYMKEMELLSYQRSTVIVLTPPAT